MGLRPIEFFLKMKLHSDLPVYKSCYDLLLEIFLFTKEFSKEYKYTVGESLKKETIDLLTLIFRANSRSDKNAVLQQARESIEVIRLLIRLMKDLKQINLKRFVTVNQKVEAAGKNGLYPPRENGHIRSLFYGLAMKIQF